MYLLILLPERQDIPVRSEVAISETILAIMNLDLRSNLRDPTTALICSLSILYKVLYIGPYYVIRLCMEPK